MTTPSVLITRPKASADRFIARLSSEVRQRFPLVVAPLMQVVPIAGPPDIKGYAGVIFTSANAIEFAPAGDGRPVYCVGRATAKRAQAAGWHVKTVTKNADDLVTAMESAATNGPLIHLAGKYRRGEIAKRLSAQGKDVDVHTLYDQQLLPLSETAQKLLEGEGPVVVPLFSPRTAAHFIKEARCVDNVSVVAISDAVADAIRAIAGVKMVIVAAPNGDEMVRGVENALCDIGFA